MQIRSSKDLELSGDCISRELSIMNKRQLGILRVYEKLLRT